MTAMYDTAKQFNRILYWDDDNRLTKTVDTTSGSSVATSYAYDAKGMRIVKEGPYGKSIYIDTGYVESGASQTPTTIVSNYIFVGNTRVVSVVKHTEEKNPATYFYASDHLGSSSVLTNQQGSYHERIEYLPYGETWVEDKATSDGYTTPYKFTGKELDTETGLYYFGARYYDAKISRWISTDPALEKYIPKPNDYDTEHDFYWYLQQDGSKKLAGLGGVFNAVNMDVYHYAGNNPVKLVDPDGESALPGAFVGAIFGVATEIALQAASNIIADREAFENLDYSDIAISGVIGAVAGATGTGAIVQGKKFVEAAKKFKVANDALKARNAAIAAGKVRNAAKTAKVAKKVTIAKKDMAKSGIKASSLVVAKKSIQTTINNIQERNQENKK